MTQVINLQGKRIALLDLDGTLYRGGRAIAGASAFVDRVRQHGLTPVFFTNNATRTPEQVSEHLRVLGIHALPDEVCTAAQAAADALRRELGAGACISYVGTPGFGEILEGADLVPLSVHDADFPAQSELATGAALGLDQQVTYAGLARFCRVVARLGRYVLTNPDARLPVEDGFLPGNGSLGALVTCATGIAPLVAGKPEPGFVHYALSRYGVTPGEAIAIGDNLDTDILAAKRAGVYAIHVATGVHSREQATADRLPDAWVDSVDSLFHES